MKKYFSVLVLIAILALPISTSAQSSVNARILALLRLIAARYHQSSPLILVGPIIKELSGPTSLKVNENGQWTVVTNDAKSSPISYRVDWGDGVAIHTLAPISLFDRGEQMVEFHHTYQRVGVFAIKVTATNSNGQAAGVTTIISVK